VVKMEIDESMKEDMPKEMVIEMKGAMEIEM
jgi:hypothetical protein